MRMPYEQINDFTDDATRRVPDPDCRAPNF
jgi:hypothetical protein